MDNEEPYDPPRLRDCLESEARRRREAEARVRQLLQRGTHPRQIRDDDKPPADQEDPD